MFPVEVMCLIRTAIILRIMIRQDCWSIRRDIRVNDIRWSVWSKSIVRIFFFRNDTGWVAPMPIGITLISSDAIRFFWFFINFELMFLNIYLFRISLVWFLIFDLVFTCVNFFIVVINCIVLFIIRRLVSIPPAFDSCRNLVSIHNAFTLNEIWDWKVFVISWKATFCFKELERS